MYQNSIKIDYSDLIKVAAKQNVNLKRINYI